MTEQKNSITDLDEQRRACQAEIDTLNQQAWALRFGQKQSAYELCQRAYTLSQSGMCAANPYAYGMAASLVTMACINADWGQLDEAIGQCFEGLALIEDQPHSVVAVDAWTEICWIHVYLSDFTSAMDFGLKALRLARELSNRSREAWALDAVASVYSATGDHASAVQAHQEALQLFNEINDLPGQARVSNNFAVSLQGMCSYPQALERANQALALDQQLGLELEECSVYGTLGEIYYDMGEYGQADEVLRQGIDRISPIIPIFLQVYLLIDLGKVRLAMQDYEQAQNHLRYGLRLAEGEEMTGEQATCHQLLSQIEEQQDHLAQALEHYKKFHTLRERVAGEEAAKRLVVLKVTHQVETAQRNAEIYRLRNVELQREIQERQRAETVLANLAMMDPLTGLYNRRQFFALGMSEFDRAVRYQQPLTALMIDVDHFKLVNDRFGHLVGDQVLSAVSEMIHSGLREVDIVGRFGGEEFAVVLPKTSVAGGLNVAERIRQAIAEREFSSGGETFHVTVSIGVADHLVGREENLDQLLRQADQALYAAKQAGRNRTSAYSQ